MSIRTVGESQSAGGKTPTLLQYIKNNNGKCPVQSNVKVIFPPNQFGGYTFITDHNFRVQQANHPELNKHTKGIIEECQVNSETLVVVISQTPRPTWKLGVDTDSNSGWEEFDWGCKIALLEKVKKQTGKKNNTPTPEPPLPTPDSAA